MGKIYYKVFIWFYEWIDYVNDKNIYSKYLYNEGYVIMQDNCLVGLLGLDFIQGQYKQNTLSIKICDFNDFGEWYEFSNVIEDFYLPNSFLLKSDEGNDDIVCTLTFKEKVKDRKKQLEIDKDCINICQLHHIKTE